MKKLESMWIVSHAYAYEGLGEPIGIFTTEKKARAFVDAILTKKKDRNRQSEFEISCAYVNPSSFEEIDKEDLIRYEATLRKIEQK